MAVILEISSKLLTGLFAGAMLLIATSWLPYWRSLPAGDFRPWFTANSHYLGRVMVPLGISCTAAAAAALGYAILRDAAVATAGLQVAALLAVLAIYFAGNKPINDRLVSDAELSDTRVKGLLRRWAVFHWVRVGLGLVAFAAAV